MRFVTLLDTETTGVSETAVCIEVAISIYDLKFASVVRSFSSLIRSGSNEAEKVNGIPA